MLAALVVAAPGLAGCTGGGDRDRLHASMSVSPQAALMDQPVTVSVRGLPTGARTTLTATATDIDGITWSATAQFEATSAGTVSLGQPSLGGSYTGVNPMGLFTLLAPPSGPAPGWFLYPDAGYDVALQASVGGRVAATATVRRPGPLAVGVTERRLRPAKGGIYGNLYLPRRTTGRRPAVLVFSGSGEGLATSMAAALLAAHGYPSLALAYFKAPGLPQTLSSIPLEYFIGALERLRAQPGVDPDHVLVAGVPSSVVHPGPPDATRPAWRLGGRPLPAVSPTELGLPTPPGKERAVIPVERIGGPVLLGRGEQDVVWPSCGYVDAITAACAPTGSPIR